LAVTRPRATWLSSTGEIDDDTEKKMTRKQEYDFYKESENQPPKGPRGDASRTSPRWFPSASSQKYSTRCAAAAMPTTDRFQPGSDAPSVEFVCDIEIVEWCGVRVVVQRCRCVAVAEAGLGLEDLAVLDK
jgi:hypothetical protein